MPTLLKAQPVAEEIYKRITAGVAQLRSQKKTIPVLATVLVGEDPASQVYIRKKGEMCLKLGLGHKDYKLSAETSQKELVDLIKNLNGDPKTQGILVQQPLPRKLDATEIFDLIHPDKDVDCFSPYNVGLLVQNRCRFLPCTPAGVMEILRHYKIDVAGKNALIVGRSDIVGKPMGLLLLHAHATVTTAHSRTRDLAEHIATADIVVAAVGKSKFLKGNLPWKSTAVVIDVGINRDESGKLCGDVDFDEVAKKVSAITPVPGGVGPMTIAMLMQNTLRAGESI